MDPCPCHLAPSRRSCSAAERVGEWARTNHDSSSTDRRWRFEPLNCSCSSPRPSSRWAPGYPGCRRPWSSPREGARSPPSRLGVARFVNGATPVAPWSSPATCPFCRSDCCVSSSNGIRQDQSCPWCETDLNPFVRDGVVKISTPRASMSTSAFVRCDISQLDPASSFLMNRPGDTSPPTISSPTLTAPRIFSVWG